MPTRSPSPCPTRTQGLRRRLHRVDRRYRRGRCGQLSFGQPGESATVRNDGRLVGDDERLVADDSDLLPMIGDLSLDADMRWVGAIGPHTDTGHVLMGHCRRG